MEVNGTLINYYFHCQRQCWLHAHRMNMENNSEDVHIGRIMHEIKNEHSKLSEIKIGNIVIDKITDEYLVEIKKSDADVEATKWQTLFYLKKLENKGIYKKGKIEFLEKNKQNKKIICVELDEDIKTKLKNLELMIAKLLEQDVPPDKLNNVKCKKCSYYEYCYI